MTMNAGLRASCSHSLLANVVRSAYEVSRPLLGYLAHTEHLLGRQRIRRVLRCNQSKFTVSLNFAYFVAPFAPSVTPCADDGEIVPASADQNASRTRGLARPVP